MVVVKELALFTGVRAVESFWGNPSYIRSLPICWKIWDSLTWLSSKY